jgi:RNA-binding protein
MDIALRRQKARELRPMLWIGKNGITDGVVSELNKLLKKKRLVKVKMLNNFISENDKKEALALLLERTGAELVDHIGFMIVLYK